MRMCCSNHYKHLAGQTFTLASRMFDNNPADVSDPVRNVCPGRKDIKSSPAQNRHVSMSCLNVSTTAYSGDDCGVKRYDG